MCSSNASLTSGGRARCYADGVTLRNLLRRRTHASEGAEDTTHTKGITNFSCLSHTETQIVLETPAMKERMQTFGYEPMKLSPEQFAAFFREDIEELAKSIKAAGITAN